MMAIPSWSKVVILTNEKGARTERDDIKAGILMILQSTLTNENDNARSDKQWLTQKVTLTKQYK
ncbi:hypothetical protein SAMN05421503_2194 [Terribacillus aidingensis]|uniref:Uncharacterized protein n=1 Tax=Terribacillus aidingensis TaxID=586416 RepID=A0A285NY99_9BACI|nr:hypothetical protein SAMN05421503_2194 [Terribacillus aidingensis]